MCTALYSCVFGDARAGVANERLEVRRQLLEVPRAHWAAARCQLGCTACLLQLGTSAEHCRCAETADNPMQGGRCYTHHGKPSKQAREMTSDQSQPCSKCTFAHRLVRPLQPETALLIVSTACWTFTSKSRKSDARWRSLYSSRGTYAARLRLPVQPVVSLWPVNRCMSLCRSIDDMCAGSAPVTHS